MAAFGIGRFAVKHQAFGNGGNAAGAAAMLQLTQLVKTVDGHVILEFVLGVVAIECAPIFACGQYIQIVVAHTVGQCLTIVTLDESFDFGVGCVDVACTVAVVQLRFESVVFDV